MADADWHRYRQLRGQPLPTTTRLLNHEYQQKKILKQDFYAAVGIYERRDGAEQPGAPRLVLYKVYHTDGFWGMPLGWLGRWLAAREIRHFELLTGVPGVPQLLARQGVSGLVREFYTGCDLREFRQTRQPGPEYFPRLKEILGQLHARGMAHNDLSKPENVLVRDDGQPGIIDLQIALAPRILHWPIAGRIALSILGYFQKIDRFHLRKLHRRARPEDFSAEEIRDTRKKGPLLVLHGVLIRRPYRALRRFVVKPLLLNKRDAA